MNFELFKRVMDCMFRAHYGIGLNETRFGDDAVIAAHAKAGERPYQIIDGFALELGMVREDGAGKRVLARVGLAEENAAIEQARREWIDRYADTIIEDRPGDYDAIEIQGVRDVNEPGDPLGTCCEVDNETPHFYSVYVHCKSGGVECVGDFGAFASAEAYANELAEKYAWPVYSFVHVKTPCDTLVWEAPTAPEPTLEAEPHLYVCCNCSGKGEVGESDDGAAWYAVPCSLCEGKGRSVRFVRVPANDGLVHAGDCWFDHLERRLVYSAVGHDMNAAAN